MTSFSTLLPTLTSWKSNFGIDENGASISVGTDSSETFRATGGLIVT